jgi:hypothetical protein
MSMYSDVDYSDCYAPFCFVFNFPRSFAGWDRVCTSRDRVFIFMLTLVVVMVLVQPKREVINLSGYQPVYETLCRLINAKFWETAAGCHNLMTVF